MFGYAGDEGIGHPTSTAAMRSSRPLGRKGIPAALSKGCLSRSEMRMQRQDGSMFWAAHAVAYLVDPADPAQTIWIISDIDERPSGSVDQSLLEMTAIFDNAAVGSLLAQPDHRTLRRSEFRLRPERLIGNQGHPLSGRRELCRIGREAGPLLGAGKSFLPPTGKCAVGMAAMSRRVYARAGTRNAPIAEPYGSLPTSPRQECRGSTPADLRGMEAIMRNASRLAC